jgi:hypothetical protein
LPELNQSGCRQLTRLPTTAVGHKRLKAGGVGTHSRQQLSAQKDAANALGVRMLESCRREAEEQCRERLGGLNPKPP